MKIVKKKKSTENCHFYSREKSLYVAWACFRNENIEWHYANTPMQYTAIFHGCKNENFQMKNCDIFLFFALKH